MIAELSQSKILIKRKIVVEENKVIYQSSKFGNDISISIPYEELTAFKEPHTIRFGYIWLIIGFLALLAFSSFMWRNDKDFDPDSWIFFTVAFVGTIIFHLLFREKVWKIKLQNYTYIFINKKLPNANEVDNFINILFEQRKKYLRETYLYVNKNIAYEPQFKNLQWLKKTEAIDNKEFDNMRKELDELFNSDKKSIGF